MTSEADSDIGKPNAISESVTQSPEGTGNNLPPQGVMEMPDESSKQRVPPSRYRIRASARHEIPVRDLVTKIEAELFHKAIKGDENRKVLKKKSSFIKKIIKTLEEHEAKKNLDDSKIKSDGCSLSGDSFQVSNQAILNRRKNFLLRHPEYATHLAPTRKNEVSKQGRGRKFISIRKSRKKSKEVLETNQMAEIPFVGSNTNNKNVASQKPKPKHISAGYQQLNVKEENENPLTITHEKQDNDDHSKSLCSEIEKDDKDVQSIVAGSSSHQRKIKVSQTAQKLPQSSDSAADSFSLESTGNEEKDNPNSNESILQKKKKTLVIRRIRSVSGDNSSTQNQAVDARLKSPQIGHRRAGNNRKKKIRKQFSGEKWRNIYLQTYLEAEKAEANSTDSNEINLISFEPNDNNSRKVVSANDQKIEKADSMVVHKNPHNLPSDSYFMEYLKINADLHENWRKMYREKYLATFLAAAKADVNESGINPLSNGAKTASEERKDRLRTKKKGLKKAFSFGGETINIEKSYPFQRSLVVEKRSIGVQTEEEYFHNTEDFNTENKTSQSFCEDGEKKHKTEAVESDEESSGDEYIVEYIEEEIVNNPNGDSNQVSFHHISNPLHDDVDSSDCDDEIVVYFDDDGGYTDDDANPTELLLDSDDDIIYIEY